VNFRSTLHDTNNHIFLLAGLFVVRLERSKCVKGIVDNGWSKLSGDRIIKAFMVRKSFLL
jgi:hypothetical protein